MIRIESLGGAVTRLGLAALALALLPTILPAQVGGLGRVVRRAAESETARQVDKLVREGVRCVFDDLECIKRAESDGKGVVLTSDDGEIIRDADGNVVSDPDKAANAQASKSGRPGEGAWANFDFVPGEEIVFIEDFSRERVGDFPRRFELIHGSFELVEWNGGRYLRAVSGGMVAIPLPRDLPERFTIEYTVSVTHGNAYVRLMTGPAYYGRTRDYRGSAITVELSRAGIRPVNDGPSVLTPVGDRETREDLHTIRVMGDGDYLKVYYDERRIANVPNAVFPRSDKLYIAVGSAYEANPILIGPIRIAAGGLDLYDRLERDGRATTQGIYFASNSARIRPESTPTLDEIARMLTEHPELRISIEGHTDSDGEDAFNRDLSERRAAAVRSYLTTERRIAGARLQSAGFGEAKPVASNATPEGKQQNRRVELVRLGG
jgi:outer membrane protein OmpA-like peptidoglycan-associated protein